MLGPADLEAWENDEVAAAAPGDATPRGDARSTPERDRSRSLLLRMATGTRLSLRELAEMRGGFFGR